MTGERGERDKGEPVSHGFQSAMSLPSRGDRHRSAAHAARWSARDDVLSALDRALRTLSGAARSARPYPGAGVTPAGDGCDVAASATIDASSERNAGALMRVNHVGEVCAQALYSAQAMATRSTELRRQFEHAAREETDHLAWTGQRLRELGDRPSLLNPLWYAGAFALGLVAGRAGDAVSLAFVVETERQVESHLDSHLARLPPDDSVSRAIVMQMKADEARHGAAAQAAGAGSLPAPVRWAMRLAGRIMTTTAHHV